MFYNCNCHRGEKLRFSIYFICIRKKKHLLSCFRCWHKTLQLKKSSRSDRRRLWLRNNKTVVVSPIHAVQMDEIRLLSRCQGAIWLVFCRKIPNDQLRWHFEMILMLAEYHWISQIQFVSYLWWKNFLPNLIIQCHCVCVRVFIWPCPCVDLAWVVNFKFYHQIEHKSF